MQQQVVPVSPQRRSRVLSPKRLTPAQSPLVDKFSRISPYDTPVTFMREQLVRNQVKEAQKEAYNKRLRINHKLITRALTEDESERLHVKTHVRKKEEIQQDIVVPRWPEVKKHIPGVETWRPASPKPSDYKNKQWFYESYYDEDEEDGDDYYHHEEEEDGVGHYERGGYFDEAESGDFAMRRLESSNPDYSQYEPQSRPVSKSRQSKPKNTPSKSNSLPPLEKIEAGSEDENIPTFDLTEEEINAIMKIRSSIAKAIATLPTDTEAHTPNKHKDYLQISKLTEDALKLHNEDNEALNYFSPNSHQSHQRGEYFPMENYGQTHEYNYNLQQQAMFHYAAGSFVAPTSPESPPQQSSAISTPTNTRRNQHPSSASSSRLSSASNSRQTWSQKIFPEVRMSPLEMKYYRENRPSSGKRSNKPHPLIKGQYQTPQIRKTSPKTVPLEEPWKENLQGKFDSNQKERKNNNSSSERSPNRQESATKASSSLSPNQVKTHGGSSIVSDPQSTQPINHTESLPTQPSEPSLYKDDFDKDDNNNNLNETPPVVQVALSTLPTMSTSQILLEQQNTQPAQQEVVAQAASEASMSEPVVTSSPERRSGSMRPSRSRGGNSSQFKSELASVVASINVDEENSAPITTANDTTDKEEDQTARPPHPLFAKKADGNGAFNAGLLSELKQKKLKSVAKETTTGIAVDTAEIAAKEEARYTKFRHTMLEHHISEFSAERFSKSSLLGRGKYAAVYQGKSNKPVSIELNSAVEPGQAVFLKTIFRCLKSDESDLEEIEIKEKSAIKVAQFAGNDISAPGSSSVVKKFPPISTIDEFERELLALKTLTPHPNIVGFQGYISHPFSIVMDLVQGRNLYTVLHDLQWQQNASFSTRVTIILDIMRGIKHMHDNQYMHRDIKPHNILIEESDDGECLSAKIADLGTAVKLTYPASVKRNDNQKSGHRIVMLTEVVGTSGYTAPEVLHPDAEGYSYPADMYSADIVMWEVLCQITKESDYTTKLVNPLQGLESSKAYGKMRSGVRPPFHPDYHNAHPTIHNLLMSCWQTEAEYRMTFTEVCEALGQLLEVLEE